jgi:hypothetical protein
MVEFRQVYTGFWFIHGWFRQVYTGLWFIHGWVKTCIYRILVYSWLGLDMFIQDSGLFMVGFRHVYTGLRFIHGWV